MPFITWKDGLFSINVPEIDDQHKNLVGIINRLHEALYSNDASDMLHNVIFEFTDYIQKHFADEEKLMIEIDYSEYKHHHVLHQELKNKFRSILIQMKEGHDLNIYEMLAFLKQWITEHMQIEDKKIGKAVAAHTAAKA